jgi:hypothetical protein
MSALVTFSITDYQPKGFNFSGYTFNFKIDNVDQSIEVCLNFNSLGKKTE